MYQYDLQADNLTPFGAAQTYESGKLTFERFRHLVDDDNIPYGNALAVVQGIGYVNELLAWLTGMPVRDHTTYNAAFAFRLGHTLYADFTHENLMVPVVAALGLFNVSRPLDPGVRPGYLSHMGVGRGRSAEEGEEEGQWWIASQMVPFSARMVTERLACERDGSRAAGVDVRVLVNDAVQPLGFCGTGEREV
uniref:Beta-galactosidase n=1 Tax=Ganoderma boninense TaxID=34458 RepID=A0A5K1K6V5_9APHY|nr:Beta-galactosidase [Ganoderma boninense]